MFQESYFCYQSCKSPVLLHDPYATEGGAVDTDGRLERAAGILKSQNSHGIGKESSQLQIGK